MLGLPVILFGCGVSHGYATALHVSLTAIDVNVILMVIAMIVWILTGYVG